MLCATLGSGLAAAQPFTLDGHLQAESGLGLATPASGSDDPGFAVLIRQAGEAQQLDAPALAQLGGFHWLSSP